MDDSHIFCTREQMGEELGSLLTFVLDLLGDFGLEDFYLELSTKPPGKAVGTDEEWDEATEALRVVADGTRARARHGRGRGRVLRAQDLGAGPRRHRPVLAGVDHPARLPDCPQRFGLEYVGADNARHRPVMIHRALFGSVERFFAILLEHYAGRPAHVADAGPGRGPARARRPRRLRPGRGRRRCGAAAVRVEVDVADEPLNARIRRWKLEKVPYILVVGDDDVAAGTVGVNARSSERAVRDVALDDFVAALTAEIETKGSPETAGRGRPAP